MQQQRSFLDGNLSKASTLTNITFCSASLVSLKSFIMGGRKALATIDGAHAASWDDDHAGPSHSSAGSTEVQRGQRDNDRRWPRLQRVGRYALAALAMSSVMSSASGLSDPGISEPQGQTPTSASTAVHPIHTAEQAAAIVTSELAEIEPNALMPAVLQSNPVSLPPGCHRTSNLISKSSTNPWSLDALTSSSRRNRIRSELVVCPVRDLSQDDEAYKVFSVNGFIEVAAPGTKDDVRADRGKDAAAIAASAAIPSVDAFDQASWPEYGQATEGYWRQRDGRLQWEPQVEEPSPLVAPSEESATGRSDSSRPSAASDPHIDHAQAYDAWSAAIGGQSADDWLGFEEWRQRHLAEKERADAERRAEGKQKKQKAKQAQQSQSSQANNASQGTHTATRDPEPSGSASPSSTDASSSQTSLTGTSHGDASDAGTFQSSGSTPSPTVSDPHHPTAADSNDSAKLNATGTTSSAAGTPSASGTPGVKLGEEALSPPPPPDSRHDISSGPSASAVPAVQDATQSLQALRHRWNFASMDCAAVIHRTSRAAKFASSILNEKKDRYMLSPCPNASGGPGGNVYVVVELCDEIRIDSLVLANHEFFSRMFKRFKVSVASSLGKATEEWKDLGIFRARNARGAQVFNISNPSTGFYRYVRIEFLEYYGNEYYCPLSLLRVYGLTQLDDFRQQEEDERRALEANERLSISDGEEGDEFDDVQDSTEPNFELPEEMRPRPDDGTWDSIWTEKGFLGSMTVPSKQVDLPLATAEPQAVSAANRSDATSLPRTIQESASSLSIVTASTSISASAQPLWTPGAQATTSSSLAAPTSSGAQQWSGPNNPSSAHMHSGNDGSANAQVCARPDLPLKESSNLMTAGCSAPRVAASTPIQASASGPNSTATAGSSSSSASRSTASDQGRHQTQSGGSSAQSAGPGSAGSGSSRDSSGGGESIYRTIAKRLNVLEANATLSMQYIEHSGQMLREVFKAMERRQESRLGDMLRALNSSNWRQIETLKRRQQVDLQRAIFEFDLHRQQTDAERRALLAEVQILASEVIFERRLGIIQLILVLSLFGFMIMTRGPAPAFIHAGMLRLAQGSASPHDHSLRSLVAHSQQLKRERQRSGPHDTKSATDSFSNTPPSDPDSPRGSAARTQAAAVRERDFVRSQSEPPRQAVERDDRELETVPSEMPRSVAPVASAPIPTGDFAEMSSSELRTYLGFHSPRGSRSQSPAPTSNEYGGTFGVLPDETADEGLETAIEDLDGSNEYGDEDESRGVFASGDATSPNHVRQVISQDPHAPPIAAPGLTRGTTSPSVISSADHRINILEGRGSQAAQSFSPARARQRLHQTADQPMHSSPLASPIGRRTASAMAWRRDSDASMSSESDKEDESKHSSPVRIPENGEADQSLGWVTVPPRRHTSAHHQRWQQESAPDARPASAHDRPQRANSITRPISRPSSAPRSFNPPTKSNGLSEGPPGQQHQSSLHQPPSRLQGSARERSPDTAEAVSERGLQNAECGSHSRLQNGATGSASSSSASPQHRLATLNNASHDKLSQLQRSLSESGKQVGSAKARRRVSASHGNENVRHGH
ncbi:unnamed protein product [Jaminaea pallidilutea]